MREISFRGFDKIEKEMFKVFAIDWSENIIITCHSDKKKYYPMEGVGDEIEFMQYTGLKDGSKTEYCESDIIECDGFWYEVVWEDDYGQWLARDIFNSGNNMSLGEFHKVSDAFIQGNIYENPELLSNKGK